VHDPQRQSRFETCQHAHNSTNKNYCNMTHDDDDNHDDAHAHHHGRGDDDDPFHTFHTHSQFEHYYFHQSFSAS